MIKVKKIKVEIKHKIEDIKSKFINIVLPLYYKWLPSDSIGTTKEVKDHEIIVSLTTIPSRINIVPVCIESLLRQRYKPNRIILWLSETELNEKKLPDSLLKLKDRGLEIRFCKDIRSHTKYFYALKENPDAILVTVDDDIFYPSNMLKVLINIHKMYPEYIICNRAHKILFDDDKNIKKYSEWCWESPGFQGPSHSLLQTGVYGVLYPPKSLNEEVLNKEKFLKLCPKADDIWLKIMAVLNGTMVMKVKPRSRNFIIINGTQTENLNSYNVTEGGNDQQLKNLINEYDIDCDIFKS